MQVVFYDETGVNPLPAGMFVTFYRQAGPNWLRLNTAVPLPAYDGVTHLGGVFYVPDTVLALTPGAYYGAEFFGTQAPGVCSAHFFAAASGQSTAVADNYRSPTLSQIGYTNEIIQLLPTGWWGSPAIAPGGGAYALARALAAALGSPIINGIVDSNSADVDSTTPVLNNGIPNTGNWSLDESVQLLLQSMRMETSQGADIDTWAADILGSVFLRCNNKVDYTWIQQIIQILQIFRSPGLPTPNGLQQILTMFYPCLIGNAQIGISSKVWLGMDTYGGMDTGAFFMDATASGTYYETPNIIVFDQQSNPTLASLISPNIVPPYFCVYFQYAGIPDSAIIPISAYTPALTTMVNACKALGTIPVYASNNH